MLYFDQAASTWPKPPAMLEALDRAAALPGNSSRGNGTAAKAMNQFLLTARETLTDFFGGTDPQRLIFTQNITESLNLALFGLLQPGDHLLITSLEHNAILRPVSQLEKLGITHTIIRIPITGQPKLADLEPLLEVALQPNTRLLALTHASNVTGTILPIEELGPWAHDHGLLFLVDSAQTAGVLPIHVQKMAIDFLGFTGHKGLLGPQGTGGFYAAPNLKLKPLLYGGTGVHSRCYTQPDQWPQSMESGTRNGPGIAGLTASVNFLQDVGLDAIRAHELILMGRLLAGIQQLPGISILGSPNPLDRVGLVSCNIAGLDPNRGAAWLDKHYQIITRAGLHCAPLAHETAGTLEQGALRLSLGYFQRLKDIDLLLTALKELSQNASVINSMD